MKDSASSERSSVSQAQDEQVVIRQTPAAKKALPYEAAVSLRLGERPERGLEPLTPCLQDRRSTS